MNRPPHTSTLFPYTTLFRSEETYFTDNQAYVAVASANPAVVGTTSVKLSDGNLGSVILGAGATKLLEYSNTGTSDAGNWPRTKNWSYVSNQGGIQPRRTTAY